VQAHGPQLDFELFLRVLGPFWAIFRMYETTIITKLLLLRLQGVAADAAPVTAALT
jgi:hypothetical protein